MGWLTWEPAKYRLYASLGFLLFAWTVSIVMHDQHDVRPSAHHSETAHIWAYARDGAHVLRPLLVKLHIPVEDLASFFVLSPVLYGMKQVAPTELNCIAVIKREPDAGPDERYKRLVVWDDLYAVWNRTAGPWLRLEREPLRGLLGAHISTTVAREIARAGITEHLVRCWLMTAAGYEALLAQSLLPVVETVFLPVANRWVDRHTYQPFAVDGLRVQRAVVEVSERRWDAAKAEIQRNGRTMGDGAFIRLKRELLEALRMFSFARQLVTMERIENFTDAARYVRPVGSVKQAEWVQFESLDREFETERSLLRRFAQRD